MAKGKRSNSPKRSRRGGRRSPKKSTKGVNKTISKDVPALPAPATEEHEAATAFGGEAEPVLDEPEVVDADMRYGVHVPSAKEMLTNFFVSLNPDIHASAQSLSQLPEQEFIFGKVASMLMAAGEYGDEVATNLAVVWQADETWTRSLLAGEVKPVEPEEPEAPVELEAGMEQHEQEGAQEAAAEPQAGMELQAPMQAAQEAEGNAEDPLPDESSMFPLVEPTPIDDVEKPLPVEPAVVQQPRVVEGPPMTEATGKENAVSPHFKENAASQCPRFFAGKSPAAKQLGEQSAMHYSPVAGLAPKDVNVQPMELASWMHYSPVAGLAPKDVNVQPMESA